MQFADHRPVTTGVRIRLDLAYDGAPFNGWAVQPAVPSVQGHLEEALALFLRRKIRVTVAGRTDTGVHAQGQVVHLDLTHEEWSRMPDRSGAPAEIVLRRKINGALSRVLAASHAGAIVVHQARVAPPGFDARFSALWRRYRYFMADDVARADPLTRHMTYSHSHTLDVAAMNEAAAPLLGLQDFYSFAKPREGATTVRELQRLDFVRLDDGLISVSIQADAFCHNMVRALMGAALRVGDGREAVSWMYERLQAKVRDAKSVLAPPHPLVLMEVAYPADGDVLARAELTRARRQ